MSARHVIEYALRVYYADSRDPKGVVTQLLAQYDGERARELAEKQRKHFIPRPPGETADYVRGLDDGLDKGADLIDPGVLHT